MKTEATMPSGPKASEIRGMFASIASGYDRANSVLSLGIHHLWRRKLVKLTGVPAGASVLDCATGTGDLAIEFKKAVGPSGAVVGSDFCKEMLETAPAKAREQDLDIKFEVADAMALPYAANTFDVVSIAFGIRNVEQPAIALQEMNRVLKPGGLVAILEFGQPSSKAMRALYGFYSDKVLPVIGGMVTGKQDAYRYLEKSSAQFPCREKFIELMQNAAPWSDARYTALSLGIAYIYLARKPL